jgi:hypothetical protein
MKINLPKIYSQNDERWKNKTLGTKGTIGAYGCLLTDIAMLCVYFGKNETPDTLNEKLKANGGFMNGNIYVWGALTKIYPDITYQGQVLTPDTLTKTQMDFIRARIDEGYPVFLQIDTIPSTSQLDEHWILAVDYDGDDFIIVDPWDGAVKRITSWGVQPQKLIYTYAWYKGTPAKPTGDYYLGIDLNNKESVKVCVQTWKDVVDGNFIKKEEYDKVVNELNELKKKQLNAEVLLTEKNTLALKLQECEKQRDIYKAEYDNATKEGGYIEQIRYLEEAKNKQADEISELTRQVNYWQTKYNLIKKSGLKFIQHAVILLCEKAGIDLSKI